jgi:hypothetical protein
MTEATSGAKEPHPGGLLDFASEALGLLRNRRLVVPALLLAILLAATNIVILLNMPVKGQFPWVFAAAGLVRVLGLLAIAVAILRMLTRSPRPAWRPDGAFWLYAATFLFGVGLTAAGSAVTGARPESLVGITVRVAVTVVTAPLAVWFVAIAVERPLAWRPGRHLRGLARWLPYFLFWVLLVVTPLGLLHATLDDWLVKGAGPWFWPVALADGPLSLVIALAGLSLAAAAYRRVARP